MLRFGHNPEVIAANIRKEIRNGRSQKQAVAIAYERARDSWEIVHPGKRLPSYLRKTK